jgi:predicted Zn-dependent protease with MMP-like domain
MHAINQDAFEELVRDAIDGLPDGFRKRIENVTFVVEDCANPEDIDLTGTSRGSTLLGVYRGVPLTHRTSEYNLTVPDTIVIFQAPIQGMARDADHLGEMVEHTVRHEIAHYFGISDRRLRELGAY